MKALDPRTWFERRENIGARKERLLATLADLQAEKAGLAMAAAEGDAATGKRIKALDATMQALREDLDVIAIAVGEAERQVADEDRAAKEAARTKMLEDIAAREQQLALTVVDMQDAVSGLTAILASYHDQIEGLKRLIPDSEFAQVMNDAEGKIARVTQDLLADSGLPFDRARPLPLDYDKRTLAHWHPGAGYVLKMANRDTGPTA